MAFSRLRTLQFLYGLEAKFPATGYNAGEPYFTTDTGRLYIGTSPTTKVRFYNSTEVDVLIAKAVTGQYQGVHKYFGSMAQISATTGNSEGDTAIANDSTTPGSIGSKGVFNGTSWEFSALVPTPQNGMYADIEYLLGYPEGSTYLPGIIRYKDDGENPAEWSVLPDYRDSPDGVTLTLDANNRMAIKPVTITSTTQTVNLKFGDTLSADVTTFNNYGQAITEKTFSYVMPSNTFEAAGDGSAGKKGLVPIPSTADEKMFLNSKGQWKRIDTVELNYIDINTGGFAPDGTVSAGTIDITGYPYLLYLNGVLCLPSVDYTLSFADGNLKLQWLNTAQLPTATSWMRILYFA